MAKAHSQARLAIAQSVRIAIVLLLVSKDRSRQSPPVYVLLSTHTTRYDYVVRGGVEYSNLSLRIAEDRGLCDNISP